jgi:hypothetical protein
MLGVDGQWLGLGIMILAATFLIVSLITGTAWLKAWAKGESQPRIRALPEIEAQERWREQDTLEKYFAEMRQRLDDNDTPLNQLPPDRPALKSAQEDTKWILQRLSPEGKRKVVSFLHGRGLIRAGSPIISLVRADLSEANLSDLGLADAALSYANLSGADLSDSRLCVLQATEADKQRARRRRNANVTDLILSEIEESRPIDESRLDHSDLSGAVLKRTRLAGCKLRYADFAGADLDEADLRAADLRYADNLTQQQIETAYGSKGVGDTLLPDDLEAPLKWKLSLKEQQEARQRKS